MDEQRAEFAEVTLAVIAGKSCNGWPNASRLSGWTCHSRSGVATSGDERAKAPNWLGAMLIGPVRRRYQVAASTYIGTMITTMSSSHGESIAMPHGRVFGGQVLAQALMAAGRTVLPEMPHRMPHSLHAYFVRPGDALKPITRTVNPASV